MPASLTSEQLRAALRTVLDPELGFSIVDLGLVYALDYDGAGNVHILLTLTTPTCPLQDHFRQAITTALQSLPQVHNVAIDFTFTPRWNLEKATAQVREGLALLGIGTLRW
ncbi:MAG: metal-sulfur cluster assembly factor [Candidatus Andersenbacteria bacterium]